MDSIVLGVAKNLRGLSDFHFHFHSGLGLSASPCGAHQVKFCQ